MKEKITLPQELQRQMLKFFLETSIPRIKSEKQERLNSLSKSKKDEEKRT